jgi:hypothetical protein
MGSASRWCGGRLFGPVGRCGVTVGGCLGARLDDG